MDKCSETELFADKTYLRRVIPLGMAGFNVCKAAANNAEVSMSFGQLLYSKEWVEYFQNLAETVNFELAVYDKDGSELFIANKNPFCKFIRSGHIEGLSCPGSCNKLIESTESSIIKCQAKLINFSFPVERFDEKVIIVGRGGFAAYEDLLEFIKIVKDNNLPEIPVSMPLDFIGENHARSISQYVYLMINRLLNSVEGKYKLEEKLLRMTALFDSRAFSALSKSPELMHRYILDTIEFVFGHTSAVFMALDEADSTYKTVYSTGKHKDALPGLRLHIENPVIKEMRNAGADVYYEDPGKVVSATSLQNIKAAHFFPIFIEGSMEGVIGIFDKKFSMEDIKILNAFRDYIQLNLENRNLRIAADKNKKAGERLNYLMELSNSIVSILDKERLLNTLLEKSLQLLKAEQGSLMLLDSDTSDLVVEARKGADNTVQEKMRIKKGESIAGMALESGGPFLVKNIEKDPRTKQINRPRYRTKSFMSIPIRIEDRLAGVLNVSDKIKGDVFNEDDLKMIESFINNAAIAIERSILYSQAENLRKLSITDHLTGIYNRRYLNRRLAEEITRYNRYKHPFSFMMLDLDKFKEYNDTFGHIAGDNLLRDLAGIMEKSLRNVDIAARFGGDEFVAIFPQTPKVDAIQITNRLKEKIDILLIEYNIKMPLSVSMGLATFPDDASSIMELIEKTDQALYLAKKGGGNRVVYL